MRQPARRRGRSSRKAAAKARRPNYRQLRHPFSPQSVFSEDAIAAIHAKALQLVQELGIKILHQEARTIFRSAGARINDDDQLVRIGSDIVAAALRTAPRSFRLRAANPAREQIYEPGTMLFMAGAGCPNATDTARGRRPGSLQDYEETLKLQQSFDVIHVFAPGVEPQDVPAEFRHYAMTRAQLVHGDKPMFVYARGHRQVTECFEMIRLALDLTDEEFIDGVWATTVINTNSPRQIDIPMAQGIIDFARAGQLSVISPFCLAGAMAPVTVAGALVLQHAEALAGITLAQLAHPGAPVSYGGFSSNVDMKSGAPAFGTPEHVKLAIGSGQLARHIGLPWRSAAGSASNTSDMQAAGENHMGLWAALQANATLIIHAAGWLEGGLAFGYEKFINDVEALQTLAELCAPTPEDDESLAWSALADVDPGGHFFATEHTLERYSEAFYEPLIADLSNFGFWTERGAQTSAQRAKTLWQRTLSEFSGPPTGADADARIAAYITKKKSDGGAPPVA
ncbi:MAG: trimethylamine methyltransferase family protein [Geminicoccaceae bacterium]